MCSRVARSHPVAGRHHVMKGLRFSRRTFLLAASAALPIGVVGAKARAESAQPVIAAASDLQFVLTELAETFTRDTGTTVRLTFGSSGNLSRQIRQGAPFELFLSADERFALDLAAAGFARDEGEIYGIGRIVILVPSGSPVTADAQMDGLAAALDRGLVKRFAIANPEHAPYGQRAEEALRRRGLWDSLQPHLILGENVSQAAQFALSGNAEGGIVAHSLVLSPRLAGVGEYALIPQEWHSPLRQRMVLLRHAGAAAESFYGYLR